MDAALQKLRRENTELMNAALDNDAELYEKECQKEEIISENEILLTMISTLDMENEAKSKAYEADREVYRETLQWKDQRIQQLESMQECALANEKANDEKIAALTSDLALEKAVCEQQKEESARMQKLKDAKIEKLKSTVEELNEENAKLSKKIEEQNKDFERQLKEKDEKISKLESLIKENEEKAVKRDNEIIQMMKNEDAEREKVLKQELKKRDEYRDKKFANFENRQKVVEQMMKTFFASHNAKKHESAYFEQLAYANEGKNGDNGYKKSDYEN